MNGLDHALTVQHGNDGIIGTSPPERPHLYGGQLLAQSLVAASGAFDGQFCHSLHGYFLNRGDVTQPLRYEVEPLKAGRSFSACSMTASQGERTIFTAMASFQAPGSGPEHQLHDAPLAPHAETLAPPELPQAQDDVTAWMLAMIPTGLELRWVERPPARARTESRQRVWLRAKADLGDDPVRQQAALAYASDYLILEPALLPHGLTWTDKGVQLLSLDHALWFHAPTDFSRWHLLEVESLIGGGGRTLCRAAIYDEGGRLVATVLQEGVMRSRAA